MTALELDKLKSDINKSLKTFFDELKVENISPVVNGHLKEIILREGKRIRPLLFLLSYRGYTRKPAADHVTSAVGLEIIQSFILIHDDIVDRSDLRRGLPSLHKMIDRQIKGKTSRFEGRDAAMIEGDILFAMGIKAFMTAKENPERKQKALQVLLDSALRTGCGQVNELWLASKDIRALRISDVYDVYDQKTGHYTFITPLLTGAIFAGADKTERAKLETIGLNLGRAFQIRDDIIGMFGDEKSSGKPSLSDMKESKRTLPLLIAYQNADDKDRNKIEQLLQKKNIDRADLYQMRLIMTRSGAVDQANSEIRSLLEKSRGMIDGLKMDGRYKSMLLEKIGEIFG